MEKFEGCSNLEAKLKKENILMNLLIDLVQFSLV